MRAKVRLAALSLIGVGGVLAAPAQAANSIWDHNGSRMTLEENGDKRKLVYTEPREGLDKAGIKKGTVLFNGEKKPNGRFAGFAKIFKGTCNPIDYFVEGTLNEQKGEIVLQGQAPVYASGTSCEVNGYSDASPASTLNFARIGDAPESAVVAESDPRPDIEQGDGGTSNDYLPPSMRDGGKNDGGKTDVQKSAPPPRSNTARVEPQPEPAQPRDAAPPAPRREAAPAPQRIDPQREIGPRRDPAPGAQARNNDPADIDESDPEELYYDRRARGYSRDPDYQDRRYTRAPTRDDDDGRSYRRRPGIWDPEDEMAEEEYYRRRWEERRRASPFWGGRY